MISIIEDYMNYYLINSTKMDGPIFDLLDSTNVGGNSLGGWKLK
jgi:hypothetical protein